MIETLSKIDWKLVVIAILGIALIYETIANFIAKKAIKFFIRDLTINRATLGVYRTIFGTPTESQIQNALLEINAQILDEMNKKKDNDTPK